MNPLEENDFHKMLESISAEEINKMNRLEIENSKIAHAEFIEALNVGKCCLCDGKMDSFDLKAPCFHWFTSPPGIKKAHFKKFLETQIGFFQLDSYFRWLADSEKKLVNINDLKKETSSTSFLERTYKYKNIEWAISVGHSDKKGHPQSQVGNLPHFHIQMKLDGRVFLKFNDFHIPFSDIDLFNLEIFWKSGGFVTQEHLFGYGMAILEDSDALAFIDNATKVADDPSKAAFNTKTHIQAPDGQTISIEFIEKVIEESRRTGEPKRKIIGRLMPDAKIVTVFSPGEGVPRMAKRSGKEKKNVL